MLLEFYFLVRKRLGLISVRVCFKQPSKLFPSSHISYRYQMWTALCVDRPRAAGVCQIVTHYRKYNRSEHVLRAHCVKHIQKTQYASFYIHCLCELRDVRSSRHRNNKPKNNLINSFLVDVSPNERRNNSSWKIRNEKAITY